MADIKKIYIAGKITGDPDYWFKFSEVELVLQSNGHLVMNPALLPEGFPYDIYLPICFAMMDACDTIYMLADWEDSKGAKMEHQYALNIGMNVVYEKKRKGMVLNPDFEKAIKDMEQKGYCCPHGFTDSDDCPTCRH